eukprot:scaffold6208_cov64-Phaeocystis_antarctica.AAC.1
MTRRPAAMLAGPGLVYSRALLRGGIGPAKVRKLDARPRAAQYRKEHPVGGRPRPPVAVDGHVVVDGVVHRAAHQHDGC